MLQAVADVALGVVLNNGDLASVTNDILQVCMLDIFNDGLSPGQWTCSLQTGAGLKMAALLHQSAVQKTSACWPQPHHYTVTLPSFFIALTAVPALTQLLVAVNRCCDDIHCLRYAAGTTLQPSMHQQPKGRRYSCMT